MGLNQQPQTWTKLSMYSGHGPSRRRTGGGEEACPRTLRASLSHRGAGRAPGCAPSALIRAPNVVALMSDWDEQEQRILAVIGDEDVEGDEAYRRWYEYLTSRLMLPCDVTGIEDFQWEEFFVFGPGDKTEYKRRQQNQPSYQDTFELTSISLVSKSRWCLVPDELKAHVRRKTDGKKFVLGLSELKAKSKVSENYRMLHDYAVWLVNYR